MIDSYLFIYLRALEKLYLWFYSCDYISLLNPNKRFRKFLLEDLCFKELPKVNQLILIRDNPSHPGETERNQLKFRGYFQHPDIPTPTLFQLTSVKLFTELKEDLEFKKILVTEYNIPEEVAQRAFKAGLGLDFYNDTVIDIFSLVEKINDSESS
jgi:hypothetical protein